MWKSSGRPRRQRGSPLRIGAVLHALFGLMLGAFGLGPIADHWGRKCVLIGATATFGVFTLCTAAAGTLQQILLFRFLAGVGLGGAMPSFISLATEYTPRAQRPAVVGLLWTGFPLTAHHRSHCLRFVLAPPAKGDALCSNETSRFLKGC